VARRGYQLSREYTVDPLEALCVRDVMTRQVRSVSTAQTVEDWIAERSLSGHQGYPVVDENGSVIGVVTRTNLLRGSAGPKAGMLVSELVDRAPIVVHGGERCRAAAERMAEAGVGRLPVVSDDGRQTLVGIVTRSDLLKPRARRVEEERRRER